MIWSQIYDPFGNMVISTLLAAIPVAVMLVALGFLHIKAHIAAGLGLLAAVVVAVFAYGMPAEMAGKAAMYGGFTGLLPIGWIVLNIIFLQQLAEQNGSFKILQASLSSITDDRRLQLLLIAFCFGACFEGAAGFGTPVAVTAGILSGLGFSPLAASGLSLIANTAPEAFGALGKKPMLLLSALLLSMAVQLLFIWLAVQLAQAVGINLPFAAWVFAWPLAKIIAVLPISLGGLGVREASLAALLVPFGADAAQVVASGLVWQAVLYVSGAIGATVLALSGVRLRGAKVNSNE